MTTASRTLPARRTESQAPSGRRERSAPCVRTTEDDVRSRSTGSPDDGRLTLERRLDSVWEGLAVAGRAVCPVCAAQMGGTGHCGGCGSRLS